MDSHIRVAVRAFRRMIRPVLQFCVRHSITVQEIEDIIKSELVHITKQELASENQKISMAKVASLTGLHRREVKKHFESVLKSSPRIGISSRVLSAWLTYPEYRNQDGLPRSLSWEGGGSEFSTLVKRVAPEASPNTLLAHFTAAGLVQQEPDGLKLLKAGYAPNGEPDEVFEMLELDLYDIIAGVSSNALDNPAIPHLHHTTEYTEVAAESEAIIRGWLLDEASRFHATVRDFISRHQISNSRGSGKKKQETIRIFVNTVSNIEEEK